LKVLQARDGAAGVAIDPAPRLGNVIGSLHSSGLITLLDAAGLAALIATARTEREFDGVIPLGAAAELRFLAPARGRLIAHCHLDETAAASVRSLLDGATSKISLRTSSEITDPSGAVVCTGEFHWSVRRAAAAVSARR
jgi:acyl-coenzyme A thioesterase PaaI-like protein